MIVFSGKCKNIALKIVLVVVSAEFMG